MLIQLVVKANDLESINSTKWDKEGRKNKKNEEMMRPCLTFFSIYRCCQNSMKGRNPLKLPVW